MFSKKPTLLRLFQWITVVSFFVIALFLTHLVFDGRKKGEFQVSSRLLSIEEVKKPESSSRITLKHVKRLEFVHITKTAGTTIETRAAAVGVRWGACHFALSLIGSLCTVEDFAINYRTKGFDSLGHLKQSELPLELVGKTFAMTPWHVPHHWLMNDPFSDTKTFTIIRNPYDRVISEFYCNWFGYEGKDINNPEEMNKWIQEKITKEEYNNGHLLPQHYYIYNNRGEKVIDYVLPFEKLNVLFPKLMKKYNFHVDLGKIENSRNNKSKLTVHDLTQETIDILNVAYAKDFMLLDYPKQ